MRRYITLVGRWITERGPLWAAKFTAAGRWITEKGLLWAAKLIAVGRCGPINLILPWGAAWIRALWGAGLGRCGPCVCVLIYACVLGGGPETDIPFKNQDPTMTI